MGAQPLVVMAGSPFLSLADGIQGNICYGICNIVFFCPIIIHFSHSTFVEIYLWLLTDKLWTNLHCYGPPKEQKSHCKHTRYKYIRCKQHIGIVVAAHRTAPPGILKIVVLHHLIWNLLLMLLLHITSLTTYHGIGDPQILEHSLIEVPMVV